MSMFLTKMAAQKRGICDLSECDPTSHGDNDAKIPEHAIPLPSDGTSSLDETPFVATPLVYAFVTNLENRYKCYTLIDPDKVKLTDITAIPAMGVISP
jgi:hypothetical protein